jgi:hypothetical protein
MKMTLEVTSVQSREVVNGKAAEARAGCRVRCLHRATW